LIVGCGDRHISVLDVEKKIILKSERAHSNTVRCVRSCTYNTNVFASGGRDARLIVWDHRQKSSGVMILNRQKVAEDGKPELDSFTGV
jgi:WD40 repeat protein